MKERKKDQKLSKKIETLNAAYGRESEFNGSYFVLTILLN